MAKKTKKAKKTSGKAAKSKKKSAKSAKKASAPKKASKKATKKPVKVKKKKTANKAKKSSKAEKPKPTEPLQHALIPNHKKLSDKDQKEVYEKYNVATSRMPKIPISDPAISHLDVKEGDIIEISRNSRTAGQTKFYRSVVRD